MFIVAATAQMLFRFSKYFFGCFGESGIASNSGLLFFN